MQPGDKLNGEADKLQCRVIFVPDIWTLMPNEAEWANIKEQYKQYGESKALKLEPPPPPQLQQNTDLEEEMLDEEELLMETTDLAAAETAAAADACEETESEKETSTIQQKHPSQTQTPKNAQEKAYYKLYRLILQQPILLIVAHSRMFTESYSLLVPSVVFETCEKPSKISC